MQGNLEGSVFPLDPHVFVSVAIAVGHRFTPLVGVSESGGESGHEGPCPARRPASDILDNDIPTPCYVCEWIPQRYRSHFPSCRGSLPGQGIPAASRT